MYNCGCSKYYALYCICQNQTKYVYLHTHITIHITPTPPTHHRTYTHTHQTPTHHTHTRLPHTTHTPIPHHTHTHTTLHTHTPDSHWYRVNRSLPRWRCSTETHSKRASLRVPASIRWRTSRTDHLWHSLDTRTRYSVHVWVTFIAYKQ